MHIVYEDEQSVRILAIHDGEGALMLQRRFRVMNLHGPVAPLRHLCVAAAHEHALAEQGVGEGGASEELPRGAHGRDGPAPLHVSPAAASGRLQVLLGHRADEPRPERAFYSLGGGFM